MAESPPCHLTSGYGLSFFKSQLAEIGMSVRHRTDDHKNTFGQFIAQVVWLHPEEIVVGISVEVQVFFGILSTSYTARISGCLPHLWQQVPACNSANSEPPPDQRLSGTLQSDQLANLGEVTSRCERLSV